MPFEAHKNERVTYWAPGAPGGDGEVSFDAPQLIRVRWEDVAEQFKDAAGNETISKSMVFVKDDVEIGGWLYRGESGETDPRSVAGAREIRGFDKTSALTPEYTERVAWL